MNESASPPSLSTTLLGFLKSFRENLEARKGMDPSLAFALQTIPDETVRTGLKNAVALARGRSLKQGPIYVNWVPSTTRLCLGAGFASRDVPRFLALATRIVEHNRDYYDNARDDGMNSGFTDPERYATAERLQMRFFYSALYLLASGGIDFVAALAALKADVVSQGLAYSIRALFEDGPGEVSKWSELYDASFVSALLAVEQRQSLDEVLEVCRRLGEVEG